MYAVDEIPQYLTLVEPPIPGVSDMEHLMVTLVHRRTGEEMMIDLMFRKGARFAELLRHIWQIYPNWGIYESIVIEDPF